MKYKIYNQIVSLPNLRIIDYGYGFTGSTHDSTAWEKTRIYEEHLNVFEGDEFIWGDSAYPVSGLFDSATSYIKLLWFEARDMGHGTIQEA